MKILAAALDFRDTVQWLNKAFENRFELQKDNAEFLVQGQFTAAAKELGSRLDGHRSMENALNATRLSQEEIGSAKGLKESYLQQAVKVVARLSDEQQKAFINLVPQNDRSSRAPENRKDLREALDNYRQTPEYKALLRPGVRAPNPNVN